MSLKFATPPCVLYNFLLLRDEGNHLDVLFLFSSMPLSQSGHGLIGKEFCQRKIKLAEIKIQVL